MSNTSNDNQPASELEIILEAARRANWDGRYGPPHLQTGRFWPSDITNGAPKGKTSEDESQAADTGDDPLPNDP